jgi:hypothetical protein
MCVLAQGCAVWPKNWGKVEGKVWCSERYLPDVAELSTDRFKAEGDRFDVALRGYPYAVASSIVLQKGESRNAFVPPPNMTHRADLDSGYSDVGFGASTFEYNREGHAPEVIVAFRGTDEPGDWLYQNLAMYPRQFGPARNYVKEIAAKFPNHRLVAVGHSLGGGLAVHVTLNEETSPMVAEAWALNPSPRIGQAVRSDERIWFAAVEGEALGAFRTNSLGAQDGHYSRRFNLIEASSIYKHFRYVLTRQMLHIADLTEHVRGGRTSATTPALEILKASDNSHCSQ